MRTTTLALLVLALCGAVIPSSAAMGEPFRPRYHFTPARNWMNDPNGLVYYAGEYHLFFQYNPEGDAWGHMSWGHAVSPDLVRWRELPVAIPERSGVMAFSGSAVVDWNNSSGLGDGRLPPLVALYTGYHESRGGLQTQNLAWSLDRGRTWKDFPGNPVLDLHSTEFRDPKVFWHAASRRWVMAVVLATEHQVAFYGSANLRDWSLLSRFGPAGATGGVWECPDLFPLPAPGSSGGVKWVLIVNIGDGAAAGGSGTQYFIGDFDGTRFTADAPRDRIPVRWLDHGRDFYAGVTWSDIPASDGRRLLIAWMNNWRYGQKIPTSPWRSAMSLVRSLALIEDPGSPSAAGTRGEPAGYTRLTLSQSPAAEYTRLRGPAFADLADTPLRRSPLQLPLPPGTADSCELSLELDVNGGELGLLLDGSEHPACLRYEVAASRLVLDRPEGLFHEPGFAGAHAATVPLRNGRLALRIFIDRSSIEVFADEGRVTITDQLFPAPDTPRLALYATAPDTRIRSLTVWPLSSIQP